MDDVVVDKRKLTHFLQALVRLKSFSGEEGPAIERVAEEMRVLGYDAVETDVHGNLMGTIRGRKAGPVLMLDAHVDTVGVPSGAEWQHGPFAAAVEGGRLFGRGAADMKGALAAMIYAAAAVDRSRLRGTVVVSATVLEEVMEGAALGAVIEKVRPDYVVIGEATDLNLNHGGRGRAEIHLETMGRPAHSSAPHLGINAVHLMLPAIEAMESLSLPSDPLLGQGIMVLTDIISEPYPGYSVIPARCRVTYDRRLLPEETLESVLGQLRQLPALAEVQVTVARGQHRTYRGTALRGPKLFPAWKLPADHEFVREAQAGLRAAGLNPSLGAYRFCTNAAYSAGRAGLPTVGFGPATEGQAHIVDEYIDLDQLMAAARGYVGIIEAVLAR